MRKQSMIAYYTPSTDLEFFLLNYVDENGKRIDFEFDSNKQKHAIYLHFDNRFANPKQLMMFAGQITEVVNLFRIIEGQPTDYTELYFETENPKGILDVECFETENGKWFQNVRFRDLNEHLSKELFINPMLPCCRIQY